MSQWLGVDYRVDLMIDMQQVSFRYHKFQIEKSQPLGHGSYGAVYKAKCDQLLCAAKILHPTILDPQDPGAGKIMQRFEQECAFLGNIRHPHIVQYLGMTTDPESRLPVLLMELLDQNLTTMLEQAKQLLPYRVQVDLCTDISVAIAYLHSNGIIHRDLSSNNVLIIADRRAKVTDFGMSKLTDAATQAVTKTMCPGTLVYMPPEAFREPPTYTRKMDCFSMGVIMIQVCTRLWPEPGPRTCLVPFHASPTGKTEVPVLEPERRKNHIDLIDPAHSFLPIMMDCLDNNEEERPSADELCERLANLKETARLDESTYAAKSSQSDITNELERQIMELRVTKEREIRELEEQFTMKNKQAEREIEHQDFMIATQTQQLLDKVRETDVLLNDITELQQINATLCGQIEQLHLQLQSALSANVRSQGSHIFSHTSKLELNWRGEENAPIRITKGASAVVNGDVAYFTGTDGRLCAYNSTSRQWSRLQDCPHQGSSLAIVKDFLTTIGGISRDLHNSTNELNSLKLDAAHPEWLLKHYPPMPTKRHNATAVSTDNHVIVAGGWRDDKCLDVVEVMNTDSLEWMKVASLPYPFTGVSLTVCRDKVYMLGGWGDESENKTRSILACSLMDLLHSTTRERSDGWYSISSVPVYCSTISAFIKEGGVSELVAVGGESVATTCMGQSIANADIYRYNRITSLWEIIGSVPTARPCCMVVILSSGDMMVIGDCSSHSLNTVEICSFISSLASYSHTLSDSPSPS